MTLTPKQQRFVEEYLVDEDAAAAYLRAGYKASTGVAARKGAALLEREDIQAALVAARQPTVAGRPSSFTDEIGERICAGLVDGRSLRSICLDDGMPAQSTVFYWLSRNLHPEFSEHYARAREMQADALVDEILDIADDGTNDWVERERDDGSTYVALNAEHIQRSRVRIDSRKWMAAKLQPKKYGESAMMKLADADGEKLPMGDVERATRLAAIFAQIEKRRADTDAD